MTSTRWTALCLPLALACGPTPGGADAGDASSSTTAGSSGPGGDDGPGGTDGEPTTDAPPEPGTTTDGDPTEDATTGPPPPVCTPRPAGAVFVDTIVESPQPGHAVAWAGSLAIDAQGVIRLAGTLEDDEATRPLLVRVGPDGAVIGADAHQEVSPTMLLKAVAVDAGGLTVAGGTRELDGEAGALAAWDAAGGVAWHGLLPGSLGRRRVASLAFTPSGALVAAGDGFDDEFWVTQFTPVAEPGWELAVPAVFGGAVRVAVGELGEVAVTHGGWDPDSDREAQLLLISPDGDLQWDLQRGSVGDLGTISAVVVRPGSDVIHVDTTSTPISKVSVIADRGLDADQLWRTELAALDGAEARAAGHDVWVTPEGLIQVLVSRHTLTPPMPVNVSVFTLAGADGALLGELPLALGLADGTHNFGLRGAPDACGALWVWNGAEGRLWGVQL